MTYRNFEIDPHWYEGFVYAHEDYDGAPDSNDSRCGSAKTINEAKQAIDNYYFEKKEEFSYTIKRARLFIEKHYEEMLQTGNTTGAIFALKNFDWKDKQEIEQTEMEYFLVNAR